MSTERIDAHHHMWDLGVRPQEWTTGLEPLDRTWLLSDLEPLLDDAGIDGTVLVETVNIEPETGEFLALAAANPRVRGVIGWVDLTAPDVADRIAALRALPGGDRLVGVRHQVQLEEDPRWLLRDDVLRGLHAVANEGLVFDLLVKPHQLEAAIGAVEATPHGRFVLAHLGKPDIASGEIASWADAIARLAAAGEVACKLSGMVTEASPSWVVDDLRPYAAHVLAQFGPDRVLAGSDWPVCLLAAEYAQVWEANRQLVSGLSIDEQDAVLGGTAIRWYGL